MSFYVYASAPDYIMFLKIVIQIEHVHDREVWTTNPLLAHSPTHPKPWCALLSSYQEKTKDKKNQHILAKLERGNLMHNCHSVQRKPSKHILCSICSYWDKPLESFFHLCFYLRNCELQKAQRGGAILYWYKNYAYNINLWWEQKGERIKEETVDEIAEEMKLIWRTNLFFRINRLQTWTKGCFYGGRQSII